MPVLIRITLPLLLAFCLAGPAVAQIIPVIFFRGEHSGSKTPLFMAKAANGRATFHTGGFSLGRNRQLRVQFLGRGARAVPTYLEQLPATVNILSRSSAPVQLSTFDGIYYRELYPRVTLEFGNDQNHIKSNFIVDPSGDASQIQWRYQGAHSLKIRPDGSLRVFDGVAMTDESQPTAYQIVDGRHVPVPASFVILAHNTVGFRLGLYDKRLPLIIDPLLTFATSIGGSGNEVGTGVSRDGPGNVYVTGWTDSVDFTTATSALPRGRGVDAFVMKLDAVTKKLVYITYIGGSGDDRALGIAADPDGYVSVCGSTTSPDFPIVGAKQTALLGSHNAFVARLDPLGKTLLFSTYLGGSGSDSANAIAIDALGNSYVAGETSSANFPVLSAFQSAPGGGIDAFVVALNRSGAIQFATRLGGSGDDRGLGIALDAATNVYLTGMTESSNFPVLNPLQKARGGAQDAFVTKLNTGGATLAYSTYLGGSGGALAQPEMGYGIVVDYTGSAYVVGTTPSADFPVVNAYQTKFMGWDADAFIAKLDPTGAHLMYSTFLGGSNMDVATSVHIDTLGNALVAGYTVSYDFPTVEPVQSLLGGMYDAFLAKLGPTGENLLFSTFLGGSQADSALALTGANEVIVVGDTSSGDLFPGTLGINVLAFGVQIAPSPPLGVQDSPGDGVTGLSGAVGVTGWALCEDQVCTVDIWREHVTGEAGSGLLLLGTAPAQPGARPDVANAYPNYPYNMRAGWGLQVLTNMLPNGTGTGASGNGTYKLHALAHNLQGQSVELGVRTISVDNGHSPLPFGSIDTPAPGATASGSGYVNFGWALTPMPASIPYDGHTIFVYIDGNAVGHPTYNQNRVDIATAFPGYANTNGAIGYYVIDTTRLANGGHTIAWTVEDSGGHQQGIGSRTFIVQN